MQGKSPSKPGAEQSSTIYPIETTRCLDFEPGKAIELMRKNKGIKPTEPRTVGIYLTKKKYQEKKPMISPLKKAKELLGTPKITKAKCKKKAQGREIVGSLKDKVSSQ